MYQLEFSSKQAKRNDPQNSLKRVAMITRRNVINLWFIFVVIVFFLEVVLLFTQSGVDFMRGLYSVYNP